MQIVERADHRARADLQRHVERHRRDQRRQARRAARRRATRSFPAYRTKLDTLAYEVVQQVNTLHDAGFTLGGVDAPVFFQPLALGDRRRVDDRAERGGRRRSVAARRRRRRRHAGRQRPGARAGEAARRARRSTAARRPSATSGPSWSTTSARTAASRRPEQTTRGEVVRQIENLRDSVSGVSLDEEAAGDDALPARLRGQRALLHGRSTRRSTSCSTWAARSES